MLSIHAPHSDVVSSSVPYVITLQTDTPATPGETHVAIEVREEAQNSANTLPAATLPVPASAFSSDGTAQIALDASSLTEGEYTCMVTVTDSGKESSATLSFYRMAEALSDEAPFGIYAITGEEEEYDQILETIRKMGITVIQNHMSDLSEKMALADRGARYGLRLQPSMRYWSANESWSDFASKQGINEELRDYSSTKHVCLNQPVVRAWAKENCTQYLQSYTRHPAFSGLVYFGDDLFLSSRTQCGKVEYSCYCPHCSNDFMRETGLPAPRASEHRRGVVPAKDPWLQWMRYRCGTQYAGFIEAIEEAREAAGGSMDIGLVHGFPDNPFVSLAHGLYSPLTQPGTVVSSYCYPFLRSPAADFIPHYEIAKMRNRHKPVWMLGVCGADHVAVPGFHVRQNYWNMLAAGYAFQGFFSWHDYYHLLKRDNEEDTRKTEESMAALTQCGTHKNWIFPTANHWQRPRARYAALFSFTTEAFDTEPEFLGYQHSKRLCAFYRMALQEQVELEFICEEEILDGILDQYDALCLPDVRALPDDIKASIDAYAESGKPVYSDADLLYTDSWHPNMKVTITTATEMSPQTMVQVLADKSERPLRVSSPDVTMRRFLGGEAEYYVLANNYADRYHGMTYVYGNPQEDYDRAAFTRDEAVDATLTFADTTRHLFDLSTGEYLGTTAQPRQLHLEPSWGRVLMTLPVSSATLTAECPASATQGDTLTVTLALRGPDGKALVCPCTAHIEIRTPSGRILQAGGYLAIHDGETDFSFPLGSNAETGEWSIRISGGFPRTEVVLPLHVAPADAAPLPLQIHQPAN